MSTCTKMTSIRMYVIFCYLYCKENQTFFPQSLYTVRSLSELENHKKFFIWKDVSVTWILQLIIYHLVSDRLTSFPEVVFSDTGFDILHCPKNNLTICIKTEPITLSVWHKSQTYSVAPATVYHVIQIIVGTVWAGFHGHHAAGGKVLCVSECLRMPAPPKFWLTSGRILQS